MEAWWQWQWQRQSNGMARAKMARLKTSEYRLQERCPATESRRKSITEPSVKYLPFFAFVLDGPSTTFSKAQGTSKHAGASRHSGSGAIVAVIALSAEWRRKERERERSLHSSVAQSPCSRENRTRETALRLLRPGRGPRQWSIRRPPGTRRDARPTSSKSLSNERVNNGGATTMLGGRGGLVSTL